MTDTGSEDYRAGLRDGRESGAKHMRSSIEEYLRACGVEHPPLPRTLGERKEFERGWDSRVVEGARVVSASISADGLGSVKAVPRHNHVTRDIKPRGQCPGCDEYHDRHGGAE